MKKVRSLESDVVRQWFRIDVRNRRFELPMVGYVLGRLQLVLSALAHFNVSGGPQRASLFRLLFVRFIAV